MTRCNSVSPSGNLNAEKLDLDMSPNGPLLTELSTEQTLNPNASTPTSVNVLGRSKTPQMGIKKPAKGILKKISAITSVLKNSSDANEFGDDASWIAVSVTGRKSTRKICLDSTSRNPTGIQYQDYLPVDSVPGMYPD